MSPIDPVLIANRGEIAVRIARACAGHGVTSIAVHASDDTGALFTEVADRTHAMDGDDLASTYLSIDALIGAAKATGASSVHPGFGFLSERADFAQAVLDAGLIWIGPSPEAIRTMGDKMTARKVMRGAGVPVIPGAEIDGDVDDAIPRILEAGSEVGFPLLIKASAGGGGKGMRIAERPDELEDAARAAMREAEKAFGDGRVYLERLIRDARHVEIQILADAEGSVLHLGERECSLQRRHQKVLEEAPSIAVDDDLRSAMGEAAVRAAEAVGYVGAGTVEFLLEPDGAFHFLEMNTRIQVEHPVTELVTGIDLVRAQLEVAEGRPLGFRQSEVHMDGHAIEVRLYAEDPAAGFLPSVGTLARFRPPSGPGIRLDAGVQEGDIVSPHYDPMLAKLIAHGPDRHTALGRLRDAIDGFILLGVRTNLRFLRELLDEPMVIEGETTTTSLEMRWPEGWQPSDPPIEPAALVAALALDRGMGKARSGSDPNDRAGAPPSPWGMLSRWYP